MPAADLSILVPALDEAGNLAPLVDQIHRAFAHAPRPPQIVLVDDGSQDDTARNIDALARRHSHVCALHHPRRRGQSAALRTALLAATAPLIATLDADLQNDPADLPRMVELLVARQADLVQGDRTAHRRDPPGRRLASAVGRWTRRALLGDRVRDTGCGTRVLRRELALALPLQRPGMHRFIPACAARLGAVVVETPVAHHPRRRGRSKYGTAPLRRGLPALRDCLWTRRFAVKRPPQSAAPNHPATVHPPTARLGLAPQTEAA